MVRIDRVENLIKENGWTKAHFCRMFDHSRTWVDDWKRGRGLPDENTLRSIANKLNTTPEYLTGQTDTKEKPATTEGSGLILTEDEKEFISILRQLPPEGREILKGLAEYQVGK